MTSEGVAARVGDTLGDRYRLERVIASGGTGTVFRARDVATRRRVAVKAMLREHATDRHLVARFLEEAQAAALVRHPHVVEVLDSGVSADGTPFIVEELLEGETLARRVRRVGRLPVDDALGILLPVAEAIAHAHARGVVHRDLNPSNIFLVDERGARLPTPKVLDFGISKIGAGSPLDASSAGLSMGTPAYMSPEQVRSARSVDTRADVWAIGVSLFEMVSGRPPFPDLDPSSTFVDICTTIAPRLDAVMPGTPRALAAFVERCLMPAREDRYADGAAALEALRQVNDGLSSASPGWDDADGGPGAAWLAPLAPVVRALLALALLALTVPVLLVVALLARLARARLTTASPWL
jgi:serine/threonine-protein kinase